MMTPEQLAALVQGGEGETLEFKRSTGELRSGMQALTALLNHRGGRVLFGVEPEGRIAGQHVSDLTLRDIAAEVRQLEPPAFPAVERVPVGEGREVLVLSVSQGAGAPYRHRGTAYKRVGSVNHTLSADEFNRMLMERLHAERRWENEPAEGWSVARLDGDEVVRTVGEAIRRGRVEDPGTRDVAELLRGLGLMRDGVLLRGAVVLFGRETELEHRVPQCLLRVARFRGADRTEFIDNRQFHGNVFSLLQKAERFLRDSLPVAGRVMPGLFERVDDPLYPPLALREALANAFCHRDYSIGGGSVAVAIYDDRLEVTSSGTLHFGLTPEALLQPHESLPWNPLVARVMYRRGVIEQWGRGTLKIVELMQQAGLDPPTIEDARGCVTVRFVPTRYVPPQRVAHDLTDRQRELLVLLEASRNGLALREMVAGLGGGFAEWEVKADLSFLKRLELVDSFGRGRGAYWDLKRK